MVDFSSRAYIIFVYLFIGRYRYMKEKKRKA